MPRKPTPPLPHRATRRKAGGAMLFPVPRLPVRGVNNLDKKPPRRPACVENSEPNPLVLANERVLGMFTQCSVYQYLALTTRNTRSIPSTRKGAMLCARRCRTHSTASPLTINGTRVHAQRHRRQAHFQIAWWVDGEIGASLGGARMGKIGLPAAPLALQIENFQLPVSSLKNQDKRPLGGCLTNTAISHCQNTRSRKDIPNTGLVQILRNSYSTRIASPQRFLSFDIILFCRLLVPFHRLCLITWNAFSFFKTLSYLVHTMCIALLRRFLVPL